MKKIYLLFLLFLTSCATTYHPVGLLGDGYSEIVMNKDSFFVTFKGNSHTSSEMAMRFALLRASELTLASGYNYFTIISSQDQSSSYKYCQTDLNGSSSVKEENKSKLLQKSSFITTTTGIIVQPGISLKIKCYSEKPDLEDVIDAQFYWETNQQT